MKKAKRQTKREMDGLRPNGNVGTAVTPEDAQGRKASGGYVVRKARKTKKRKLPFRS